jgi:hypothetical protein
VLSISILGLVEWFNEAGAPYVWLHGLYIYSPMLGGDTLVYWKPLTTKSRLYLSHVTLHGGYWGITAKSPAYLAGAQLACMPPVLLVSASV